MGYFCLNFGLLWDIVARYFELFGFAGRLLSGILFCFGLLGSYCNVIQPQNVYFFPRLSQQPRIPLPDMDPGTYGHALRGPPPPPPNGLVGSTLSWQVLVGSKLWYFQIGGLLVVVKLL